MGSSQKGRLNRGESRPKSSGSFVCLRKARRGARLVFVLVPLHPRAIPPDHLIRAAVFAQFAKSVGVEVIDATTLLDDAGFIDPVHPSREAARKVTSFVARGLMEH
jgi:hypothetical protein